MSGNDEAPPVAPEELLARYILQGTYVRKDSTLRPNPFIPHPYPDLSVTRHLHLSESEIWASGERVSRQTEKPLVGRADTRAQVYLGQKLRILAAPVLDNPNHANVTGWPADKPTQKIIAMEIAANSLFCSRSG